MPIDVGENEREITTLSRREVSHNIVSVMGVRPRLRFPCWLANDAIPHHESDGFPNDHSITDSSVHANRRTA